VRPSADCARTESAASVKSDFAVDRSVTPGFLGDVQHGIGSGQRQFRGIVRVSSLVAGGKCDALVGGEPLAA
jgi:hypothetical protein